MKKRKTKYWVTVLLGVILVLVCWGNWAKHETARRRILPSSPVSTAPAKTLSEESVRSSESSGPVANSLANHSARSELSSESLEKLKLRDYRAYLLLKQSLTEEERQSLTEEEARSEARKRTAEKLKTYLQAHPELTQSDESKEESPQDAR